LGRADRESYTRRKIGGGLERGSLAMEGLYTGCMSWVHAPPPPLAPPNKIPYDIPSF